MDRFLSKKRTSEELNSNNETISSDMKRPALCHFFIIFLFSNFMINFSIFKSMMHPKVLDIS